MDWFPFTTEPGKQKTYLPDNHRTCSVVRQRDLGHHEKSEQADDPCIAKAPRYVPNDLLHRDLKVDSVEEIIAKAAQNHKMRLHRHPNVEAIELLDNSKEAQTP